MKVSILVPVYGAEKFIERCAISLLEQTYSQLELLFLDDCCTDRSIDILESCLRQYPACESRILKHPSNQGLAAARRSLLNAATGDYVLQVDADDYLEVDAVQTLVEQAVATEADMVAMDCWFEWENERRWYHVDRPTDPHLYTRTLLSGRALPGVCLHLIRRSLYSETGVYPMPGINLGEDYMVTPRLSFYAKHIAYVPRPLYHYVQTNQASYTTQLRSHSIENIVEVCRCLSDFFEPIQEYQEDLHAGMWLKKVDFAMRVRYADLPLVDRIPTSPHVNYSSLSWPQKPVAWMISKKAWRAVTVYATLYGWLFRLVQKCKGR